MMKSFSISLLVVGSLLFGEWKSLADEPLITWDSIVQEHHASPGETEARVAFQFTNQSPQSISVMGIKATCGCTAVDLPPLPWEIKPGQSGSIPVKTGFAGKQGTFTKLVQVTTTAGNQLLTIRVIIPPRDQRALNLQTAQADRQAVFKNNCAECHATPAIGKTGRELFKLACGICHEAEHRASMVPDLSGIHPKPSEYWEQWIRHGKPGTLMPAFGQSAGGPLSDEQVKSLVDFLSTKGK